MAISVRQKKHHKEIYICGSAAPVRQTDWEPLKELSSFSVSEKGKIQKENKTLKENKIPKKSKAPKEKKVPKEKKAPKETKTQKEKHLRADLEQSAPSVSLFAIIGFFAVSALMIFVMLAQVNYNEVLRETARLNTHLDILHEQQRVLSITFESVINMDEIERYAKDVLGMSKPEAEQVTLLRTLPEDKIEVIYDEANVDRWREFSGYITFLFDEYIR